MTFHDGNGERLVVETLTGAQTLRDLAGDATDRPDQTGGLSDETRPLREAARKGHSDDSSADTGGVASLSVTFPDRPVSPLVAIQRGASQRRLSNASNASYTSASSRLSGRSRASGDSDEPLTPLTTDSNSRDPQRARGGQDWFKKRQVRHTVHMGEIAAFKRTSQLMDMTRLLSDRLGQARGESLCKTMARRIVDNRCFVGLTTVLTVFALCGDDCRLLLTNKPFDPIFNWLVGVCIVVFSAELWLSCLGKDDYFLGFFFCLDFLSTCTLVLDLTIVADTLFSGDATDKARSGRTARMGAKVGRVVRVLRLLRIVKLYKAMYEERQRKKLREKRAKEAAAKEGDDDDDEDDIWGDDEAKTEETDRESMVSRKLSAKTTQRTIVLVLTMLLVLPMLESDMQMVSPSSAYYGADEVQEALLKLRQNVSSFQAPYEEIMLKYVYHHNWFQGRRECPTEDDDCPAYYYSHVFWMGVAGRSPETTAAVAQIRSETVSSFEERTHDSVNMYNYGSLPLEARDIVSSPWQEECSISGVKHIGFSVLSVDIPGYSSYRVRCPDQLRPQEFVKYAPSLLTDVEYGDLHFAAFFDTRPLRHSEATFNMLMTVFVCVVLCVASLFFASDANTLVLAPMEHMISKIEAIRDNPLSAMKMADDEFKREENLKVKKKLLADDGSSTFGFLTRLKSFCSRSTTEEILETAVLERTIIKLGSLLALGFGQAGAHIVSSNMKSSSLNAMTGGNRVHCIIGLTRIGDFGIFNVVLQGRVMTFVNQIAEIVHGVVDEFHGAVNKNNGDTFLVVWKTTGLEQAEATKLADMSIIAFARILGAVHRSPTIANYRSHPGLQQRLGARCRVNLTSGLHYGWAIEGAVGSEYKIDASYVSPNVSIANDIEMATRIYRVSLLVTSSVIEICTAELAERLRLIDKVIIKGSKQPVELYCLDLDYSALLVDAPIQVGVAWNPRQRFKTRQVLEDEKKRKMLPDTQLVQVFEDSRDLAIMSQLYTTHFLDMFSMGYQNYSQGEWQVARQLLTRTKDMLDKTSQKGRGKLARKTDGPSAALLRFMEGFSFQAPDGWVGVHKLGSNSI
eukprot:TRINITY_DN5958_c0_g3_i1.p1 TRINITY_DN5958_c0_g3~~TRINITY_DN5958_c0_g3_i1.p1  ORF type:complete len:1079 (-),score=285.38 TRINITY_DN5958_c0_g3_i1:58-3294(-)